MLVAFIKIGIVILNIIYLPIKCFPVKNRVTMFSRQSNEPSDDFRLIHDELIKRNPGLEVKMLCRTLDGGVNSKTINKIKYAFHMISQMYHIATSKVVILDTYCIPVSVLKHKKSLKVIQIWHSMGTMKKFGCSIWDKEEGSNKALAQAMKMHKNYDYIFASSDAYKSHLAAGFGYPVDKIITFPLPRLDLLKDKQYESAIRNKIYAKYPKLKDKPTIVYCPTFRKDEAGFDQAIKNLYDAIDTNHFNFVLKKHPLSKVELEDGIVLADEFSTFEMLFAADYVISDYSCIIYEAAIRNIPLLFYDYDIELYREIRDLAIDYDNELPGVISTDARIIADELLRIDNDKTYDMMALKKFTDKYVRPTEHATQDIAEFIETLL